MREARADRFERREDTRGAYARSSCGSVRAERGYARSICAKLARIGSSGERIRAEHMREARADRFERREDTRAKRSWAASTPRTSDLLSYNYSFFSPLRRKTKQRIIRDSPPNPNTTGVDAAQLLFARENSHSSTFLSIPQHSSAFLSVLTSSSAVVSGEG